MDCLATDRHSFVIPAFGVSPHLSECLESLRLQSRPGSEVVVSTSTPSGELERIAATFGARYHVHDSGGGIGRDWNAALDATSRDWVTIAHQDDVYLPDFLSATMDRITAAPDASLVMTGYAEILGDDGVVNKRTPMLRVKSLLLELGFLGRSQVKSVPDKLRMLRFGCPVPCPSVTLGPSLRQLRFREDLKVDLDWEAWIRAARVPGSFCYDRRTLMYHRIHSNSETSAGVRDGVRAREDAEMFASLWPQPLASVIARAYSLSYEAAGS